MIRQDILRFFLFFLHFYCPRNREGHKLTTADIYDLMDELSQQLSWSGICVNKIDVTNVGLQHDLTELLKLSEDIVIDDSLLISSSDEQT